MRAAVLANMAFRRPEVQREIRGLGGVELLLSQCQARAVVMNICQGQGRGRGQGQVQGHKSGQGHSGSRSVHTATVFLFAAHARFDVWAFVAEGHLDWLCAALTAVHISADCARFNGISGLLVGA